MKLCLAAVSSRKFLLEEYDKCHAMLESYYSMEKWLIPVITNCDFFMLDSGAFSFMNKVKGDVNFDEYLDGYIDFINKYDIKHFFELDVDVITGLDKVEQLRERLERETGKKPIPVWHKSRGKQYFLDMCNEYDYVAIGGIVTKEIKPVDYKYFPWFIDEAHKRDCKIHGLGFTNVSKLYLYHFDSVDSTSWTSGGRFGSLYHFTGKTIEQLDTEKYQRRGDLTTDGINRKNYYEWLKFQEYAERNL